MNVKKQDVILAGEPQPAAFSFEQMQRMAVSIAKSQLFGVKDADQALSLMLIAQAEGKHPALIARDYDIIQGRPAKKAEAMLRDFQASGGKVEWHQLDDVTASATFTHPMAPKPLKIDWDIPRAKRAGLMDKNGGMYSKYPRAMLRSRCISEGIKSTAPAATSGFYTPEEVRDFDNGPAPVAIQEAVAQAVATPEPNEIEAFLNSMDVTTLDKLEAAFAAAWRSTKDAKTRQKYKATYDEQKQFLVEAQQKELRDMDSDEVPQ
jgi:hypothetical protein